MDLNRHELRTVFNTFSMFVNRISSGYCLTDSDIHKIVRARDVLCTTIDMLAPKSEIKFNQNVFETIKDEYLFFQKNSTEAIAAISAIQPQMTTFFDQLKTVRFLDYGCGDGEFTTTLLSTYGKIKSNLAIELVEPDKNYLSIAKKHLEQFSKIDISVSTDSFSAFDLGLCNHVLYYVSDLSGTIEQLYSKMANGGRLLITMATEDNCITKLERKFCTLQNRAFKKFLAADVQKCLEKLKYNFTSHRIESELLFQDGSKNRMTILKFINNVNIEKFEELISYFDEYILGEKIKIPLDDTLFVIDKNR